jgi:hypothetical protein
MIDVHESGQNPKVKPDIITRNLILNGCAFELLRGIMTLMGTKQQSWKLQFKPWKPFTCKTSEQLRQHMGDQITLRTAICS